MPQRRMMPEPAYSTEASEQFLSKNLDLLTHWSDGLSLRTVEEMEISGMQLGSGYFLLALLHIMDSGARTQSQYLGDCYAKARTLMREGLGGQFLCHIGAVDGDVAALFCFPRCTEPGAPELAEAEAACRAFTEDLHQAEPDCRFTLLLGEPFRGHESIRFCYEQLVDQLRYLLFLGKLPYFARRQPARQDVNPQYADSDAMTALAGRMAGAIGRRQAREMGALEEETLERLFSGGADSFQPVYFRLYVYLCALLKSLETRNIVDRRFTRRRDFFTGLTSAPSYHEFCSRFHELILSVLRHYDSGQAPSTLAARIQQARDYCGRHFREPELTVSALAEHFGMAQPQLSGAFKRQFGVNPLTYLNGLRLEAAKELLRTTDLTQQEIARQCGFANVTTMQRLFTRVEHCTPGRFRQSNP